MSKKRRIKFFRLRLPFPENTQNKASYEQILFRISDYFTFTRPVDYLVLSSPELPKPCSSVLDKFSN